MMTNEKWVLHSTFVYLCLHTLHSKNSPITLTTVPFMQKVCIHLNAMKIKNKKDTSFQQKIEKIKESLFSFIS